MTIIKELSKLTWSSSKELSYAGEPIKCDPLKESTLTLWVYQNLHARTEDTLSPPALDYRQVQKIRECLTHEYVWEPGWLPLSPGPEIQLLGRAGLIIQVSSPEETRIMNGEIELRVPAVRPRLSPGFIHVTGPHGAELRDITRIYLSCSGKDAPEIIARLASSKSGDMTKWTLKALCNRHASPRTDGIVLYVASSDMYDWLRILRSAGIFKFLKKSSSIFTCHVDHGISWAREWPDTKNSFGDMMSILTARSILRAMDGYSLSESFEEQCNLINLNPERPWDGPRS
jgi:hypothetical protein